MIRLANQAWRWLLALGLGGLALLLVALFGTVFAALGASFASCDAASLPAGARAGAGPRPSSYALQSIPPERLALYEQGGARFGVNWAFLASIGKQECGSGTCEGVNGSGCAGPMQIAYQRESPCSPGSGPTLWERYAVNANPTQPISVNDPADAIFTAARILHEAMGAPPIAGSYSDYYAAACRYYGACAGVPYAQEVMTRAVQYGFNGPGSPTAGGEEPAEGVSEPGGGCQAIAVSGSEAAALIVKVAESQVGQSESPLGSNCTRYGPCEEWCSLFASWVWMHAGVPIPGPTSLYGYSGALYTWVKEHGGQVLAANATPAPGDAVFYGLGPAESDHVGIVVRVLGNEEIETVEGNYANRVSRVGPFRPSDPVGEGAPIYGYAQPPSVLTTATGPTGVTGPSGATGGRA